MKRLHYSKVAQKRDFFAILRIMLQDVNQKQSEVNASRGLSVIAELYVCGRPETQLFSDGICCRVPYHIDGPRAGSPRSATDGPVLDIWRLGPATELSSLARLRRRSDGPTTRYRLDSRRLQAVGDH